MAVHNNHTGTIAGTVGGTLLSIFANIHPEDIVRTFVLAGIGAVASFIVSLVLKWVAGRFR
jgi:hypothetical protein